MTSKSKLKRRSKKTAPVSPQVGYAFRGKISHLGDKIRPCILVGKEGDDWVVLPCSTQLCYWTEDDLLGRWFDLEISYAAPNKTFLLSESELGYKVKEGSKATGRTPFLLTKAQTGTVEWIISEFESYQGVTLKEIATYRKDGGDPEVDLLKKHPSWRSKAALCG